MNIYASRLDQLKEYMHSRDLSAFIFPTADYHASEYVAPFFKTREYFSGFTGSAGTLLVTADGAYLWADGRYFIQAAREIEGSGIELMKMQEPGVPTLKAFLAGRLSQGDVLGYDGRCMTAEEGREYAKLAAKCGFTLRTDLDPADEIWTDRPPLPCHKVMIHDQKYVGETPDVRLSRLREAIAPKGDVLYLDSKLESIMWLLSIRGADIECNPVAYAHLAVDMGEAHLFIQEGELTEEVRDHLAKYSVTIHPYDALDSFLTGYAFKGNALCDPECVSDHFMGLIGRCAQAAGYAAETIASPLIEFKSIKNEVELANIRECYRRDSAMVCRFIKWVTDKMAEEGTQSGLTETGASDYLDALRAQIPDFMGLSFGTICGYGANAAMMHYSAVKGRSDAVLAPCGMLLVDSGGQYLSGTTDVTRTTALGPVTDKMRRHYTLTAVSNLQLMGAVFMKGCTGAQLDMLARMPMWKEGLDYKCGTGHGIGYFLSVHEAPPTIRWGNAAGSPGTELKPGMIVSDEPGVYLEGEYGIRIETILEVVEHNVTPCGHFLAFSPLTLVPLDRALIDPAYLTPETKETLNAYHARVYEEIAPLLTHEEAEWLRAQTMPIE